MKASAPRNPVVEIPLWAQLQAKRPPSAQKFPFFHLTINNLSLDFPEVIGAHLLS
jgi:hypothetical protein